jgi:stage II sporulation protein AA (anti-sigma F factor antagonist)
VRSEREDGVHAIRLFGELDLATAAEAQRELERAEATDAEAIVLDLSGLTFIDSTGVRLLVAANARSRADANRLSVVRGQQPVQRVLELCGVVELLPFADQ